MDSDLNTELVFVEEKRANVFFTFMVDQQINPIGTVRVAEDLLENPDLSL
jgi:hypothetical protein